MSYILGEDWQKQAGCLAFDPETFVPSDNGRPPKVAKLACARCPVRQECEEFVLSSPWKPYGTWAGMSQRELGPLWLARHPRKHRTKHVVPPPRRRIDQHDGRRR